MSAAWYCSNYLPPASLIPAANLPPVSLTPVANLPPVSTTQGELVAKFAACVAKISANFRKLFIRGLGEGDLWKKTWNKKSRDTVPLKLTWRQKFIYMLTQLPKGVQTKLKFFSLKDFPICLGETDWRNKTRSKISHDLMRKNADSIVHSYLILLVSIKSIPSRDLVNSHNQAYQLHYLTNKTKPFEQKQIACAIQRHISPNSCPV